MNDEWSATLSNQILSLLALGLRLALIALLGMEQLHRVG